MDLFRITKSPQIARASLVAQTVKNMPAIQDTWVRSLVWEDLLGKSMATHSSIPSWRIPMDKGALQATVQRIARRQTQLKH